MSQKESVTLSLSTVHIPKGTTNIYGYFNMNCTDIRFDNINLRSLLGRLYTKYTIFNIALCTVANTSGQSNDAIRNLSVKLGGLNFINGGYDVIDSNNGLVSCGIIHVLDYQNDALMNVAFNINNSFTCQNEIISLSIRLFDAPTNVLSTTSFNSDYTFIFMITPVE